MLYSFGFLSNFKLTYSTFDPHIRWEREALAEKIDKAWIDEVKRGKAKDERSLVVCPQDYETAVEAANRILRPLFIGIVSETRWRVYTVEEMIQKLL